MGHTSPTHLWSNSLGEMLTNRSVPNWQHYVRESKRTPCNLKSAIKVATQLFRVTRKSLMIKKINNL